MDCQKNTARLQRMKNTQSKIKPINTGEKLEQSIVQGVKITMIILTQEVKMKSKVLREKLNFVICRSSKSRFLKEKHNTKNKSSNPIKRKKQFSQIAKHGHLL